MIFQKLVKGGTLFYILLYKNVKISLNNMTKSQISYKLLPGAPFLGGSGGSSPPKIRRKEAKNSPERGAQAPHCAPHFKSWIENYVVLIFFVCLLLYLYFLETTHKISCLITLRFKNDIGNSINYFLKQM